jgi:hypothetical protein
MRIDVRVSVPAVVTSGVSGGELRRGIEEL